MPTYAALIRGVNVGGRAKLPMPLLKAVLESLGYKDVVTYIQSGNAVFRSTDGKEKVAAAIAQRILADAGLEVTVVVHTHPELARIAERNPFLGVEREPRNLHVLFLDGTPAKRATQALDPDRSPPDRFQVDGQQVYLHHPNGLGRSKLTADYFEKTLGVRGTARNWNTVLKILALTRS